MKSGPRSKIANEAKVQKAKKTAIIITVKSKVLIINSNIIHLFL